MAIANAEMPCADPTKAIGKGENAASNAINRVTNLTNAITN
jgi:hypothetical protein